MIRPILKYGDALLHDRARPVEAITDEIRRLIDDMIETMIRPRRRTGRATVGIRCGSS